MANPRNNGLTDEEFTYLLAYFGGKNDGVDEDLNATTLRRINSVYGAGAVSDGGSPDNQNAPPAATTDGASGSQPSVPPAAAGAEGAPMAGRSYQRRPPAPPRPPLSRGMWRLIFGDDIDLDVDTRRYKPLYEAAMKGDWESASRFIREDNTAAAAKISIYNWTALHVACANGRSKFVKKLIQHMPREALSLQDSAGYSPLHYAVVAGSMECAEALLTINPDLIQIADKFGNVPFADAVVLRASTHPRQKELVWQLCLATPDDGPHNPFAGLNIFYLLLRLIANQYLDIAYCLVRKYPVLLAPYEGVTSSLYLLSAMLVCGQSIFQSQSRLGFWENIISHLYNIPLEVKDIAPQARLHSANNQQPSANGDVVPFCSSFIRAYIKPGLKLIRERIWRISVIVVPALNRIYEEKAKHIYALELLKAAFSHASSTLDKEDMLSLLFLNSILSQAAEKGIVEVFKTCMEFFPDGLRLPAFDGSLLQTCIKHRQENVMNFLLENMTQCDWMDENTGPENLQCAAKLGPFAKLKTISGSALQMQSEVQWFKAVEKITHPVISNVDYVMKEDNKRTAQNVFMEEHKELLESGEKWMKDTANSCMLVATLIATVVFAAAFTVPGGNNQDSGIPIFLPKAAFLIFAVSDALALFSSSTSILVFLSILTSRFREEDFLISLPRKLIIGLASLFFAIVTMMVAFGATLSIVLGPRFPGSWATIPAVTLPACIPVGLFIMLQLPLFIQMVKSTFWSNIPWR